MKNIIIITLIYLTFFSCNKDEDQPIAEIDKLPSATQVGANTFGCLLDGIAFKPGGGPNPLDCVYQFVDGGYYFGLQGNKRNENNNKVTIALGTNNLQIQEGLTYNLLNNSIGNAFGIYSFSPFSSYTSAFQTGELKISKLDLQNQIISGYFWFDIIDFQGNLHQIREGRFDMQYTQ